MTPTVCRTCHGFAEFCSACMGTGVTKMVPECVALRERVATEIMGWHVTKFAYFPPGKKFGQPNLPPWNLNVGAAFEVVEKLKSDGWHLFLHHGKVWHGKDKEPTYMWDAQFQKGDCGHIGRALEDDAAKAICLAALAALTKGS